MNGSPNFEVEWLNGLNRISAKMYDVRTNALDTGGQGDYEDWLRVDVELDGVIRDRRQRISRMCNEWFTVAKQ